MIYTAFPVVGILIGIAIRMYLNYRKEIRHAEKIERFSVINISGKCDKACHGMNDNYKYQHDGSVDICHDLDVRINKLEEQIKLYENITPEKLQKYLITRAVFGEKNSVYTEEEVKIYNNHITTIVDNMKENNGPTQINGAK